MVEVDESISILGMWLVIRKVNMVFILCFSYYLMFFFVYLCIIDGSDDNKEDNGDDKKKLYNRTLF